MDGVIGLTNGINGHAGGVNGHGEPGSQSKPSLRLSFAEYKRISNLLVLHLRRAEDGKRCSSLQSVFHLISLSVLSLFVFLFLLTFFLLICVAAEEEEDLKKSAVVNWYLKEIESEIDSEEELINRKGLIEKVIHRLVHYVSLPS